MAEPIDAARRSLLRAGAGVLALPVAGCLSDDGDEDSDTRPGEADSETIERGGTFTVGLPGALEAPNPLTAGSAPTDALLDLLYQPGVLIEPDGFEAMPWAFVDWSADDTGEGTTVSIDLRDDLEWTDGEAFTAEDVLFTYEYYAEHEPGRFRSTVDPIESVGEGNGADVELVLSEAIGSYEAEQLSVPLLPEHVWSDVDDPADHEPDEPVGLGPGRLTAGDPESGFEIALADDWPLTRQDWVEEHGLLIEGGPFLDAIELRPFGSTDALDRELAGGGIDAIHDAGFDPARADAIDDREGLGLVAGHDDGYDHYTMDVRTPPLDDQAFRQALGMAMDRDRWADIQRGYAIPGSVVVPPGFEHLRPETAAGEPVQQTPAEDPHPVLEVLGFRGTDGELDAGSIQEFLASGAVVDGGEGSYAGREYPGSLTGFGTTGQNEAAYDYELGEVRSDVLAEAGVEAELYADGQTVEELHGGPIELLAPPDEANPREAEFIGEYVRDLRRLGIPVEREIASEIEIADRAYLEAEFDLYPGQWSALSAHGAPTLYDLFHSDNAPADGSFGYNAAGYGLEGPSADEAIEAARGEPDADRRDELVREAAERIYLEAPTLVRSYRWSQWPVNTADFAGFLSGIPGVGSSNLRLQALTVHRR
ncbi:ABC transporter substrate-binding protein [Halalkalicoccus tibetensis]|uniref:ABC transporter substrate-binding protein n=1 Tax=Halalkalicoccus tibetensis TaxID=175632 RepID=A0ABD5V568_9EURY